MRKPMMAASLLLVLTGCGGAAGGSAGTTSSSPSANPGATYLRIVKPVNDCTDAFFVDVHAVAYPKIRTDAAACVKVYQQFNGDLLALETEAPKAKADIDAQRKSIAAETQLLVAIAGSTSDVNTGLAVIAFNKYDDGGASALVRSDLGLPAPPAGASPKATPAT